MRKYGDYGDYGHGGISEIPEITETVSDAVRATGDDNAVASETAADSDDSDSRRPARGPIRVVMRAAVRVVFRAAAQTLVIRVMG